MNAPVPGFVIVRSGTRRWALRPGDEVTFGRGEDRDIRIGHEPLDDFVSRDAGSLTGLRDGVLIRNTSKTQAIRFLAMPGPELRIRPGMAVGSMPFEQVRIDIPGRYGAEYTLHLDARGMLSPPDLGPFEEPVRDNGRVTRYGASRLSERERRMLAALCEPVLTLAGSRPATYREIAERLGGTTPASVRTGLDRLRNRLSDTDGIPGLRGDEDSCETAGYLEALAHWAIDTGEIDGQVVEEVLDPL
ncbi:hypothetical protein GCM10010472_71680 [Pseudonocardia halophobica]|uniref:FHA domain-containing protein n=1 Tax=Pseudonocardia halophobica TaxID=29401 RepID=A0A9W6NV49_9PSEU|nr:hypothetical protein [Pseudonocardia halophobica]GLL10960.1 hypothetical protein GCM10017577_21010 [Pseudonocardia halophobica]